MRDGGHRKRADSLMCGCIAILLPTSQRVDGRPAVLFTRPQRSKNNLYLEPLKSLKLLIPSSALSEHNFTSPFKGGRGNWEPFHCRRFAGVIRHLQVRAGDNSELSAYVILKLWLLRDFCFFKKKKKKPQTTNLLSQTPSVLDPFNST